MQFQHSWQCALLKHVGVSQVFNILSFSVFPPIAGDNRVLFWMPQNVPHGFCKPRIPKLSFPKNLGTKTLVRALRQFLEEA